MNDTHEDAGVAAAAWVAAEAGGDAATIDALLTDDFAGVGPLGFVLSRAEWLDRHASGALRYSALRLEDPRVKEHGDHAVVLALQTGEGTYQGHPVPQALRATIVLRGETDGWRVAHVHTSFVAGTPGAPPIPGRPSRP
ncbi:nuclear transport factor 2 family protein [Actinophytocola sp.]|jgi:ketosteroid isomerase-like protein|uniref:nuclear transport factor 2 family protein n=1 Tax=Actinophytocola sp. TaxID=1872138 RepID=UPI002EDA4DA1